MVERRVIRVLTVNSKTFFFVDKGVSRGIVVDHFRLLERAQQEACSGGKLNLVEAAALR